MTTEHNAQALRPQGNGGVNGGPEPLEKDFTRQTGNSEPFNNSGDTYPMNDMNMGSGEALHRIRTAGSISISPELFEKIYLSPQNKVSGDLRKTFGNPTPLALLGFLLSLSPLSCDLMGWRGAGGNGAAGTGAYFFFGGMLMVLGGILEFILGNTFPFVVFTAFGAFWFSFGATLQPFYNAYGAYSPDPTNPAAGLKTSGFQSSFAFFLIFMGLLCLVFLICSLRTNVCFVVIFFTLVVGFTLLAGSYWYNAKALAMVVPDPTTLAYATRLQITSGAFLFVTSMAGWWIFFAIMLAALDFPLQIPVGDLSTLIKGASEKAKVKDAEHMA